MIIGLEGTTSVGKTTLAHALARSERLADALVIPCYYHCAPDPDLLPNPAAATPGEQLQAISFLLQIETTRATRARIALAAGRDVIVDRTVATLMAHAHAVGQMRGFDIGDDARRLVAQADVIVPHLTFYLAASPAVITERVRKRPGMPPIFYDPQFMIGFDQYFISSRGPTCVRIDASQPPEKVACGAAQIIAGLGWQ